MTQATATKVKKGYKESPIGIIPEDWEVVRIRDIAYVRRGASPRPIGDPKYFTDKGRGWVRIADVTSAYKYLRSTTQYLSDFGVSKSVKVDSGDIIMSICATIGKPILVKMKACIHDGFVVFRNLSANIDIEYFFYFLQKAEKQFAGMKQTGTQGNLNTTIVGRRFLPLPSVDEQKKIASILSDVDGALQQGDEAIANTERFKKGLMKELLKKGIGHKEFRETKIGEIPKEWELVKLKDLVDNNDEIVAGPFGSNLKVSDYKSSGVPIIRLQNIAKNRFVNKDIRYISPEKAKELKYHSFKAGDIVLAKLGDPIGNTCIVPDYLKEGIVVADVVRIRVSKKRISKYFLEYLLNASISLDQLRKQVIGSTRPRVNITQVRNLNIPLPTLPEQHKIAEILTAVDEKLELQKEKRKRLELVKKGLMKELLTGRIRVKV